jgi:hypothetical protein
MGKENKKVCDQVIRLHKVNCVLDITYYKTYY